MTIHHLQQFTCRTVLGDRVGSRSQAVEGVIALGISVEDATQVVFLLIGILLLIETCTC